MASKYRPKTERKYIGFRPCYVMQHALENGETIKRHKSCSSDKYILYKNFDHAVSVGGKMKTFSGQPICKTMVYKTTINPASGEMGANMEMMKCIEVKEGD